ncbi:MAG: DUF2142 domain-containing protein [Actinomycetota bacterium]|nr:DUF2142 domain-containing protein [Actinomycetota bacterium]
MPRPHLKSPNRERLAAVVGSLLVVAMLVAVVTDSRPRLAATNTRVLASGIAFTVLPGHEHCQGGEFVPEETRSLRLYVGTFDRPTGPPLDMSIRHAGGELASSGHVPAGYPPGRLEAQIREPGRDVENGSFCLRNAGAAPVSLAGNLTPLNRETFAPGEHESTTGEGIRIDYFRGGRESWIELSPEIARRFRQFKPSFFGTWTMWGVLAGLLLLWGVAAELQCRGSRLSGGDKVSEHRDISTQDEKPIRRAGRRFLRWMPKAGWACACIAVVNAAFWASVIPPFQTPDEPFHVGYAQYLAETGRMPDLSVITKPTSLYRPSEEYSTVLSAMPFSVEGKPSWSSRRDSELRLRLGDPLSRREETAAGGAVRYSPLYYGLEAVPARVGARLNALDRLYVMRLASALLAGITVGFVFLFLRELLRTTPWAWTLGALTVAFQPVFGFMSGGVNNDSLLYAAGAALMYLLARAFRLGLDVRLGVAVGAASAVGFLAKPTMLAVLPGAALGLLMIILRTEPDRRSRALWGAVAAGSAFALPSLGWFVLESTVLNRPLSATTGALSSASLNAQPTIRGQLSYLWQYFLPRLPVMKDIFKRYPEYPVWEVYIQGFIGRFGYFQYGFPLWANQLGLAILLGVAAAAAVALRRARHIVRGRLAELGCYAAMALGLVLLSGVGGYRMRLALGFNFEQPRYLFPVLALYGAVVALAARAGGRRWAPSVGAFLLVLAMGHSLFAMLLTIGRYYA